MPGPWKRLEGARFHSLTTPDPLQYDAEQSIGKRCARMDAAGRPFCFTIDGQTKEDGTVTVRNRDDGSQMRIDKTRCLEYLDDSMGLQGDVPHAPATPRWINRREGMVGHGTMIGGQGVLEQAAAGLSTGPGCHRPSAGGDVRRAVRPLDARPREHDEFHGSRRRMLDSSP